MSFFIKGNLNKKILCIFLMSLILGSVCSCQTGKTSKAALDGPLLAVLCKTEQGTPKWKGALTPSAIHIINVQTQSVTHKIETRSPAYSFTVGPNGKLYTSNSGGLGKDIDRAIGVADPRQGKVEEYIELDIIPGEIIAAGEELYVTSGLYFPATDEISWCRISSTDNRITSFRIPGVTSSPVYHNGKIYVSTTKKADKDNNLNPLSVSQVASELVSPSRDENIIASLLSIDPLSLNTYTIIDKEGYFGKEIAFDEGGNAFGLISRSRQKEVLQDVIVVFRPGDRKIVNVISLPPQSEPAHRLVYHKDKLYVSYYDSNSLKGSVIVVYDSKKYQPLKKLGDLNGPVDMLIKEGKLYILCNGNSNKTDGEVIEADADSLQVINKISVGKDALKLEYVPKHRLTT